MVVVTEAACISLAAESGIKVTPHSPDISKLLGGEDRVLDESLLQRVQAFNPRDIGAPVASGSNRHDGMIVVPCSMGTLGRIAHGTSEDLICRAADVTLKERRKLILVTREMPLSLIHLRNMQTVTEAGAMVAHACPHFYHAPQTVEEVVDTVVDRVLDQLGVESETQRWRADEMASSNEQEAG
jgi:4-hydroxy-3-polyprenylbenzoate decarboxylase